MRWMIRLLNGVSATQLARSQGRSRLELPDGIGVRPDYTGPLPNDRVLGRQPAYKAEVATADSIIAKVPSAQTPFEIAKFFLAVGEGTYGAEWRQYVQGWPVRWNPVIVEFFRATHTKPSGDLTPWCAAFANWCYQRVLSRPATDSASSGSFRVFGNATDTPTPGDYVVFRSRDKAGAEGGHGHVGFFVKQEDQRILVLGGNQMRQGNHTINEQWIGMEGRYLVLHSFRTHPSLHA